MMSILQKIKLRGVGKNNKQYMRIEPKGTLDAGLFGINIITPDHKEIVITEG